MPRPSLADASTSQPKLPGTERSPATNTPFVVRCRDVRIGSPGAKHVYLTLATWCESYVGDADHGTCWPSLRTVQTATEYGRTAFKEHYQFLLNQRFVTSQKGAPGKSSKKTIWTPDAAMRRRSEGSDSDPSRGVGFRPPKDQRRSEVRTPSNAAATTEDRKQQQQQRLDGLIAYIAPRYRELSRKRRPTPSPWPEDLVRADFAAGKSASRICRISPTCCGPAGFLVRSRYASPTCSSTLNRANTGGSRMTDTEFGTPRRSPPSRSATCRGR